MIKNTTCIFLAVFAFCSVTGKEELPVRMNVGGMTLSKGCKLMALKHIPEGGTAKVSSWIMPENILVNNQNYSVRFDDDKREFTILQFANEIPSEVARGKIVRMNSEQLARNCGFGVMAMTNMILEDYALNIQVSNPHGVTNLFHIAHGNSNPAVHDVVVFKNLYVSIGGVTNKLDFAMSLLNAGLPESERLPPLQPQP